MAEPAATASPRVQPRRERPDWGPAGDAVVADHLAYARNGKPVWAENAALRTKSFSARHILARGALGDLMGYADLVASLRERSLDDGSLAAGLPHLAPEWAIMLARVIAFQRLEPDDVEIGARLLAAVHEQSGLACLGDEGAHSYAQLLFAVGAHDRLRRVLPELAATPARKLDFLRVDLLNPFAVPDATDEAAWVGALGGIVAGAGLAAVDLGPAGATPFDRLRCEVPGATVGGPLISVIMTAYRPDIALLTSVRSILAQTWRNLELLVVDDASPPEFDDVLRSCAAEDDRVRLIRRPVNGGTYLARNAGLDAARGEFVTGQDADDWSHPRRLELQVAPLLADAAVRATVSQCLRVSEDLVFTHPGYDPCRLNTSSLMFRRHEALKAIGYFDSVRKAADSEYLLRMVLGDPGAVHKLAEPLALVRMVSSSLSRSDFTFGWHHEARRAYRILYENWHRQLRASGASRYLERTPRARPFPAPVSFRRGIGELTTASQHYDVVFLTDWRGHGGPVRSIIEEIRALTAQGYRVGIAHLEAAWYMHNARAGPCQAALDLIADGTVDYLQLDQGAQVDLLVIRYPPTLQFPPSTPTDITVGRAIIVANQTPSELDGSDCRYTVPVCEQTVADLFGVTPLWVPQGPLIRRFIEPLVQADRLAPFDMPGIIDFGEWSTPRARFRSDRPVIGRISRDTPMKWPERAEEILHAYPADEEFDVRVLGGADSAGHVLGAGGVPPEWIVYRNGEIEPRLFLFQIDFFVYFHHSQLTEAFGRAILEAIAAGCVAVLPPHFEPVFGAAAVYCQPVEVRETVRRFWADHGSYRRQVERGQGLLRARFGYDGYVDLIASMLANVQRVNASHT